MRDRRRRDGIPMNDTTWEEIIQAAEKVGMAREQVKNMRA
jgi:LDH2 family malate/lactate/ureidoglycolate dehydrogenase